MSGLEGATAIAAGRTSVSPTAYLSHFRLPSLKCRQHRGTPAGGTSVSIEGTNFSGSQRRSTSARTARHELHGELGRSITAAAPAGTGTVDVTVVTPGGTSATTQRTSSRMA